jgi:cytochrome P450
MKREAQTPVDRSPERRNGLPFGGPLFPPPEEHFHPYGFYSTMRRDQPVAHDKQNWLWAVYRYDDVKRVLTDHTTFSSEFQRIAPPQDPGDEQPRFRSSLISSDPPRHRQLRDLISRAFTPRAVANLEPRIVEITHDLLDKVVDSGRMDLVGDLSYPLPVIVIAEMLGIPTEDRAQFKRWSDSLVDVSDDSRNGDGKALLERRRRLQDEMDAYFRPLIEERRFRPRGDLISGLVQAEIDGQRLSEEDTLTFCTLLLIAGNITTTNLIANAMHCFLEHPDQFACLRAEPNLLPSAIEEVLRYESPVQVLLRVTARGAEVGGQTIPAGERVFAWIGSANRDEAVFPHPERFDIARNPNPHLAFGHAIHFCVGAPLARLEARVALSILLERMRNIERADGAVETTRGGFLHGITRLPLRFTPGRPWTPSHPMDVRTAA